MIRTSTCSSAFSGVFVAAVAAAAVLGGTASSVAAQSLSGEVDRPGRWLVSVHSGDRLVAETISAPDGTFTVSAPAGRYGVAVAAVDTEVTLEAVEWGETGLADWSIAAPDPAPPLPSGSSPDRCTLRPAADSPAGMAWLRARRAFALARLGLEEGGLVVDALVLSLIHI